MHVWSEKYAPADSTTFVYIWCQRDSSGAVTWKVTSIASPCNTSEFNLNHQVLSDTEFAAINGNHLCMSIFLKQSRHASSCPSNATLWAWILLIDSTFFIRVYTTNGAASNNYGARGLKNLSRGWVTEDRAQWCSESESIPEWFHFWLESESESEIPTFYWNWN